MGTTLTDVAEQAGVSLAAASQILRHHPTASRFKEETRLRVLETARRLNFRPNFFASQIMQQNRKLIMLCVWDLADSYAAAIGSAFEQAAAERGFPLLVSALANKQDAAFYDSALGPQGILAVGVVGYASRILLPDSKLIEWAGSGVHVAAIGRPIDSEAVSQVIYDDAAGVVSALDHLLGAGARRIWVLGTRTKRQTRVGSLDVRRDVAVAHLNRLGIACQVLEYDWVVPESGHQAIAAALAGHSPPPDAVFCVTDVLALGCMSALREAGLMPGRDVAVVGYNDDIGSRHMYPPLTSVRIPVQSLGRHAAQLLIDRYEGREATVAKVILNTQLIPRESSRLSPAAVSL